MVYVETCFGITYRHFSFDTTENEINEITEEPKEIEEEKCISDEEDDTCSFLDDEQIVSARIDFGDESEETLSKFKKYNIKFTYKLIIIIYNF